MTYTSGQLSSNCGGGVIWIAFMTITTMLTAGVVLAFVRPSPPSDDPPRDPPGGGDDPGEPYHLVEAGGCALPNLVIVEEELPPSE